MKIATWNVNSLKVRLPHVIDWLNREQPDVLCLQELKMEDKAFPLADIEAAGYRAAFSGQKTYNGVALLSKLPPEDVCCGLPNFADEQKRLIAATIGGVRVISAYFPNGQALDSDKFQYKLQWIAALRDRLRDELRRHARLVLAGDFNIAPEDRDAHPDWKEAIHVSPAEREAFSGLTALGLHDAFRLFEQADRSYSWWDYRMGAFRRNFGLRIDHILVSDALRAQCRSCSIDVAPRKFERPSDHAPVSVDLSL